MTITIVLNCIPTHQVIFNLYLYKKNENVLCLKKHMLKGKHISL